MSEPSRKEPRHSSRPATCNRVPGRHERPSHPRRIHPKPSLNHKQLQFLTVTFTATVSDHNGGILQSGKPPERRIGARGEWLTVVSHAHTDRPVQRIGHIA
jgi:hypothetical protein